MKKVTTTTVKVITMSCNGQGCKIDKLILPWMIQKAA